MKKIVIAVLIIFLVACSKQELRQDVPKEDLIKCSKLANERKDECYLEVAVKTGFFDSCKLIEEEKARNGCYLSYAANTKDAMACERIKSDMMRQTCLLTVNNISDS